MNYGRCKLCNKTISYESIKICQNCYDEQLKKVKEYIDKNGKGTIDEISKGSNVARRVVEQFYIDDVLYKDENKEETIERLKEKREKLKNQNLIRELNSIYKEEKNKQDDKSSGGMHHFRRN